MSYCPWRVWAVFDDGEGGQILFLYDGACRTHIEREVCSVEGSAGPLSRGLRSTHGTMNAEDRMLMMVQARISPGSRQDLARIPSSI
jgi:hypothetical protein